MKKGRKEILESMLKFSNYYWYESDQDRVNNQLINVEDYDPVIDTIFKANAYELEKIYGEIEDSDERILNNLVSTLIPDHNLLPTPAFTVAKLQPQFSRLKISPTDVFKIEGKDDIGTQVEYYFTSVGHHEYPKSEIAYILTDNVCIDYTKEEPNILEDILEAQPYKRTKTLWLGIEIEDDIEDNDQLTFFIGNEIIDPFRYDEQVFNQAKWHINGEDELALKIQTGIQHFFTDDGDRKYEVSKFIEQRKNLYEQQIINFFDSSFVTLSGLPTNLGNLKKVKPPPIKNLKEGNWTNEKKLLWIKATFDAPIANKFIIENQFYLNAMLLINRKLKKQQIVKNNFDRILLPLPTDDYFLSINSIWDEKSKINSEQPQYYKAIDYVNFQDEPGTYTIRPGNSVRRVDQHDISTKIVNLLDLIEEEYSSFKEGGVNRLKEDFDAIEKSVNRIRKQLPNIYESESEQTAFYCVANFRKNASIITYNYWETQGDKVDALATKKGLEVSSDYISLDDNSKTITAIQKGRASVNKINYHNNLKKAILSRNKIVTIGDIANYCYNTYPDLIQKLQVDKRIARATNPNQYENIIEVKIQLHEEAAKGLDVAFVKLQIQNGLNANTTFYTPIQVKFVTKF